jgi:hypothetical protein
MKELTNEMNWIVKSRGLTIDQSPYPLPLGNHRKWQISEQIIWLLLNERTKVLPGWQNSIAALPCYLEIPNHVTLTND